MRSSAASGEAFPADHRSCGTPARGGGWISYRWNLGWSGAVLVVFFVIFPALALVVRRKWKLAEVRRAEIRRLVRLAAAEAERAEREATAFVYSAEAPDMAVAGGEIGMLHCAVCFSPTTTRCSRCKAVRYCSGSCQIIHWRQGHKYDCHPPLIDDHHKGRSNVSDLKGVEGEISEPNGNGLDNEGRGHSNDGFYVDQSVSNKLGAQDEPYILVDSSLEREVKPVDAEPLEILYKKPVSLEANLTSEIHSDSGEYDNTNFVNASDKGCSFVSTKGTSSSSCSTISGSVEMPDDASSNEDLSTAASGQHANANAHDHLEESFSSSSPGSRRGLVTDANQTNDMIFPHTTAFATSLRHVSFSIDLKRDPTCINKESDFKLSAPSNTNIFSPSSVDARLCENAGDCTPMGLSSINPEKTKTLISSESSIEGHGETLDLNAAETLRYAKSIEAQSCHNNHHPQLDAGLHSELSVRLSSIKSSSVAASHGRSEYRGTMTPVIGESGDVGRESNNEQLKSSSPTCPKDHSSSLAQGQSILRNASARVENVSPFARKSHKVDSTLPNGKVSAKRTVQLITSASLSRHSQPGVFNYGYGKYNYKMFFPYDNFIKLYNSDKVDMRPCGLVNCGNSCYANAVLQCLAFTRPLAAFILEGLHAKACPKKGWCFTCEFETLLIKAKQGKSPLSPTGITSHIHDIGSNFSHGREEDAHEFLRYVIDAMQSACLKEAGASAISELAQETTIIQLIFGGYLRSKIKCMRCQGKSEHRERMMDLTVDIHGDIGTLEEALARFTASEVLEGENKYKCGRCKSFERAKKQLTILEAPNVLTIALKRYQSGKYGKLNKMVQFPEYLNLGPYMRGSDDNSPVYRLYAVVVHIGHMNAFSGHYVCYVKDTQGKWFKADDSVVKQVELQKVLSQGAYMLLYARCSPRAPCLLRKEMAKRSKSNKHGECHNPTTRPSSLSFHPRNRSSNNHTCHRTDDPSNFGSHDLFDERFRRPAKVDPSSDSSSLFSCSDEGSSWSTESTKDSATSEEFTDYGESGYMSLNSPCRLSVCSDGMPCSPNSSRRMSVSSDASPLGFKVDKNPGRVKESSFQGRDSTPILYSTKRHRNLTEQCSSRSNTEWVSSSEVKSGVLFRRSSGERTTQTFY